MAKLNGVKTLDMVNGEITKVEYDGEVYAKVDGQAQAGDLALRVKGNQFEISVGSFYLVERIRGINEVMVNDDADDLAYRYTSKFDIFRKVSADRPPTSEYVLVTNREPKAGDFVKFDEAPRSYLTAGKYYEIKEIDGYDDPQIIDDDGDEYDTNGDDFEVYEKAKAEYREVKREAKVGELIKIVYAYGTLEYKNGDIRKVTGAYPETSGEHAHVEIEPNNAVVLTKEYVVLEPIEPATKLTHNGVEYTLVDRKAQPGDVVVFTETTSRYFTNGEVYGPVDDDICVIDNEGDELPVYSNIDVRTPANVKVYAPVAKEEALKVGDYCKTLTESRYGRVAKGVVGEITRVHHDGDFTLTPMNVSYNGIFTDKELVRATDEEVAEAKRQAEEKAAAARWAKIGRKPNEFKKGDIVRLTEDSGANDEGEIVEIAEDGALSYFDECGYTYEGEPDWFELITPVEQRFDRDGADA